MYIYMCRYIYMSTCVHIYIYIHVCIHIHIHIHSLCAQHIQSNTHTRTRTCTCTCLDIHLHIHIHKHMHRHDLYGQSFRSEHSFPHDGFELGTRFHACPTFPKYIMAGLGDRQIVRIRVHLITARVLPPQPSHLNFQEARPFRLRSNQIRAPSTCRASH